jgi:hypothetical protein
MGFLFLFPSVCFPDNDSDYFTIADIVPATSCPAPWRQVNANGTPVCVAPSGPGCFTIKYKPTRYYRFVRGTVAGIQFGQTCAFGPTGRTQLLSGERCGGGGFLCVGEKGVGGEIGEVGW